MTAANSSLRREAIGTSYSARNRFRCSAIRRRRCKRAPEPRLRLCHNAAPQHPGTPATYGRYCAISSLDPPAIDRAIDRATQWLDREQTPEGFWVGMLESSYCMEAEWLLAMHFLGVAHPREQDLVATLLKAQRDRRLLGKLLRSAARRHQQHGRVLRGVALRGHRSGQRAARQSPRVDLRARRPCAVRVFTRYWLALLGEWPWQRDTEPAAGSHCEPAVVPVQHL